MPNASINQLGLAAAIVVLVGALVMTFWFAPVKGVSTDTVSVGMPSPSWNAINGKSTFPSRLKQCFSQTTSMK